MKGFKPTGYGPSAGFRFPARLGFSGSTGSVTNVAPYVRRRAFATGGFVRQDKPRMKSESVGDTGSALVRRKKATTQLDAESGGRTPLRPGFAFGGVTGKAVKAAMAKAQQSNSAGPPPPRARGHVAQMIQAATAGAGAAAGRAVSNRGPLTQMVQGAIERSRQHQSQPATPRAPDVRIPAIKGRFYEKGGSVPRRSGAYTFGESLKAIPELFKELSRNRASKSTGMAKRGADLVSGRQRQVDRIVDEAVTGGNYSRGGKAKRMGYAKGGGISKSQAKQIAERTVGEHVRYPAPKGHKGLKKSC